MFEMFRSNCPPPYPAMIKRTKKPNGQSVALTKKRSREVSPPMTMKN
jgi:hypothetical protein